jgi:uncharacterized protein VirK/YbjX
MLERKPVTITYPDSWGASRAGPRASWTERRPSAPNSALAYGLAIVRERLAAHEPRKAVLFAGAVATAPTHSAEWLGYLAQLRDRLSAEALPFDLATKIYRPFFSRALDRTQRLRLLRSHYDIVTAAFGRSFVRSLLDGRSVQLGELTGASGERYIIDVLRTHQFKDEGEMVLSIYARSRPDKRLANIVATVGDTGDGATMLWIGGMQGVCGAKPLIDAATADLGGVRPKIILLEAAWAMLAALRYAGTPVRGLAAVGNHVNIVQGHHAADYDGFWRDLGGQETAEGHFMLPAAAPRMGEGMSPNQTIGPKRVAKWRARLDARSQLTAAFARMVSRAA